MRIANTRSKFCGRYPAVALNSDSSPYSQAKAFGMDCTGDTSARFAESLRQGVDSYHPGVPARPFNASSRFHLGCRFAERARRYPTRVLLQTADQAYTYDWMLNQALGIATILTSDAAFRVGSCVILMHDNSVEYITSFYGALMAGGIVVPVHPTCEVSRVRGIVDQCEPAAILAPASQIELLRSAGIQPVTAFPEAATNLESHSVRLGDLPPRDANSNATTQQRTPYLPSPELIEYPAVLLFTSGSTGEPKGVMLSHRNLIANAIGIRRYLRIRRSDRALALLPFHFAFGNSVLQSHVLSGAALVLDGNLACPESCAKSLRRHQVTSLCLVPDQVRFLTRHSFLNRNTLQTVRYLGVAGGALAPDEVATTATDIAPTQFFVMYGQTEATARISYLPPEELPRRSGSIGRGMPGVTLQVVNAEGLVVHPGELGEIRATGAGIMLGYWRDPAATQRVVRDGWLYTGDLGTVDEEGWIYVQGRKHHWVKVAGHRVHPQDVVLAIRNQFPEWDLVIVPFEWPFGGTRLAMFVRRVTAPQQTEHSVTALCRSILPAYQVPSYIEFLSDFPHANSGKTDLQELARIATSSTRLRWNQDPQAR